MIIESGILVAAGLVFTFYKCPVGLRMAMLSNPLFMDILIFTFLTLIHWGTFSGVMVASVGALVCSGMVSLGRFVYGHVAHGAYTPGLVDLGPALQAERAARAARRAPPRPKAAPTMISV